MLPYVFMLLIALLSLGLAGAIRHEFRVMNKHPERYHHHFKH